MNLNMSRRARCLLTPSVDRLEGRQLLTVAQMRYPAEFAPKAAAAPAASTGSGFMAVAHVNNAVFQATAAIADNDVWAVGYSTAGKVQEPLAVHFNGTTATVVATPNIPGGGVLSSVSAAGSNNVWAVGYQNVGGSYTTLVEHWNGTSWSIVSTPKLPTGAIFSSVTAVSPTAVWAAGDLNVSKEGVLIEHWNGTSWSVVSSPAFSGLGPVYGIAADSANDVWAVGGATTLHFNGSTWSAVPAVAKINLVAVDALSPTNVWAVGIGSTSRNGFPRGVIEHWDGTSWTTVTSPWPNTRVSGGIGGIAAVSPSNIWVTGTDGIGVAEQRNGTSWTVVATPTGVGAPLGPSALSDGTVVAATETGYILEN
jgi:hypothetical protein